MFTLFHEYEKKAGKGVTVVRTPVGIANTDKEADAKAIAVAYNKAGIYSRGSVKVGTLPVYSSVQDFNKAQDEAKQAEVKKATGGVAKKLNKFTDTQLRALAAELGVDVSKVKTLAKTAEKTETK